MRRTLLVPLLVVAAGTLAACVPVAQAPPPAPTPVSRYCAPTTPKTAAEYQAAFDQLRHTYTEWATADGAVPVSLDGSRRLWLFGDTYVGQVTPAGGVPQGTPMVSNSAVLQKGRCFTPILGGSPGARSAWIADPGPQQAYWPSSAIVDAANDVLNVVLLHVQRPMNVIGTRIAKFRLSTLAPLGVSGTIKGTSTARPYGSTAFADGGYAYLYSSNAGDFHVARAPIADIAQQSKWQYWTGPGDTWSAPGSNTAAQELEFAVVPEQVGTLDVAAPIAPLRVRPFGGGYLGTAMLVDGYTRRALSYTAPSPQGPWTYAGDLARTPTGVMSYGAQTVFSLDGPTAVLVHSTNLLPGQTDTTINRYGFRFVTVTLPPAPLGVTVAPDTTTPTLPPSPAPPSSTSTTSSTTTSTSTTAPPSTTSTTAP
jgi:hypothetical protein